MRRRAQIGRTAGAVVLACAAVAAGIFAVSSVLEGDDSAKLPAESRPAASPPGDGWRWESYETIELQVPDDWDYGTTGSPPCLVEKVQRPYVGRPGAVRAIGCGNRLPLLAYRASYLWFDAERRIPAKTPGVHPADHGWVEEIRLVDGVQVTVVSDDDSIRRRILDSARVIDGTDANGCTPDHPLARQPQGRPSRGGMASLGTVESIALCRYAIGAPSSRRRAPLIASSVVRDKAAVALVDAITSAPEGSGPNDTDCLETYGSEVLVLKLHGSNGDQEVLIRYSGCHFNGTDDGLTVRRLTADVLRPILTGIHRQTTYSHALYELVVGPAPPKWR